MARRAPATEIENEEIPVIDDTEDEDIEDLLVAEANEGGEDQWKIRVNRVPADGGPEQYEFGCRITELPLWDKLQKRFPEGGYFKARIFKNGKTRKIIPYHIASQVKETATAIEPMNGFQALADAMMRQSQVIADTVKIAIEQRPQQVQTPNDPAEMFVKIGTLMMGMISPLLTPLLAQRSDNPNPIEAMKLGIEIANSAGGGGRDTNMLDIFKSALEGPLGKALSNQLEAAQQMQRMLPHASPSGFAGQVQPMPVAAAPPQQPMHQANAGHPALPNGFAGQVNTNPLQPLVEHLQTLVTAAERNAPHELYAGLLSDNLPDDIWNALLVDNKIIDGLCAQIPRMNAKRDWFLKVIDMCRKMSDDDSGDGSDTVDATA